MREVLEALNHLVAQRIIEGYAIGGAVGAAFYIEALRTEDVDEDKMNCETLSAVLARFALEEKMRRWLSLEHGSGETMER